MRLGWHPLEVRSWPRISIGLFIIPRSLFRPEIINIQFLETFTLCYAHIVPFVCWDKRNKKLSEMPHLSEEKSR